MELSKGYKQSDVGLIPSDWEVKTLDKEIDLLTGYPFPSSKYSESGIKLLRGSNVKRGETDWSENITQFWEQLTLELKTYLLQEGDIVIAMDGSLVGRSFARLSKTDLPALLLQRVARVRSNKIDLGYLKEFICSDYFTKYCDSVKTVSAIPHISPGDIRNFKIPLPPTKAEQTAIATALSDADALISSLEKLIEKKRNIKQGAMQELLKPKKGWVVKKLGEIVIYKNGTAHENCVVENGDYIIVNSKFISSDAKVAKYSNEVLCPVTKDEILMVLSDVPNGKAIAKCFLVESDNKYTLNQRICSLKTINADPKFLYYLLNRNPYFLGFDDGAKQTNLRNIDVLNCPLTIPPTPEEQIGIATILSDMNLEIELLEKKLSKSKMLKHGMMQELLTGKIRLTWN